MSQINAPAPAGSPSRWKFAVRVFFHTFAMGHAGLLLVFFGGVERNIVREDIARGESFALNPSVVLLIAWLFCCFVGPLVLFFLRNGALRYKASWVALVGSAMPMVYLFIMQFLSPNFGLGLMLTGYLFLLIVLVCVASLVGFVAFFAGRVKVAAADKDI
jgi:hypothetical protein